MRKNQRCFSFFIVVVLVVVCLGGKNPQAFASIDSSSDSSSQSFLQRFPYRVFDLKSGLKVFLIKYPSPGAVAYSFSVHVGSRNEVQKGRTGFAHFFEHLMFRGTSRRSAEEFGKLYVKLGCENNAWTSSEMTNYHGVISKKNLEKILSAEADRFLNLEFDEKSFKDEAGAILGEYHKNAAQPEFFLEEKLLSLAFKAHPYGHTTMGYKDDILNYPNYYNDVWPFFEEFYNLKNVTAVIVGDLDFNQTKTWLERYFNAPSVRSIKKEQKIKSLTQFVTEPEQNEKRSGEVFLPKKTQTRIAIAYKVPAFSTKVLPKDSTISLALLSDIGFSVVSDFQKKFRFNKKWIDSVGANGGESVDPSLWTIQVRLTEQGDRHRDEVIAGIEKVVSEFSNLTTTKDCLIQFNKSKKRIRNIFLLQSFNSPEALGQTFAYYTNFENDINVIDRYLIQLNSLKIEDIKFFAQTYLVPKHQTTVVLRGESK